MTLSPSLAHFVWLGHPLSGGNPSGPAKPAHGIPGLGCASLIGHGSWVVGRGSHTVRLSNAQHGFTLIEVLVALGIVAIALAAGMQASSALVRNSQRASDVLLAQICAENELVKARLARQMPPVGSQDSVCLQADTRFNATVSIASTLNPNFRRMDVQVRDAAETPILRLSTVVGKY